MSKPGRTIVESAHEPPVPQNEMPEITDEILAAIPEVYRAGLLNMASDAGHLISQARKATAVADAIRLLTSMGRYFEQREIPADVLYRIRPKPRGQFDYAASRKLRFEDDVGSALPVACSSTAGLVWRLAGGEITSMPPNGAYVEIERPGSRTRFFFQPI